MALRRFGVRGWQWLPLAGCFAFLARPCAAQDRAQWWFAPAAGFSGYRMKAINHEIRLLNQLYLPSYRVREVSRGASVGLQAGIEFASGRLVAFGYDWLWASSDDQHPAEYDLGAHLFQGAVGYQLRVNPFWSVGVEAGAGFVMLSGARIRPDVEVSGYGGSWEVSVIAHRPIWRGLSVLLRSGYRRAVIGTVKHDGSVLRLADGSPLEVDYSGAFGRAGLQVRWP